MQDRQYQLDHIDNIATAISTRRKVCVQLPTGGGKTVEFAFITKRFILANDKAVLILVHRKELMQQAAKTIREIIGIEPYLITSDTKKYSVNMVYIGMVESTLSRLNMFTNVGLVIIDECHVANFNKVHSIFLEELILGFSATPIATSKKDPLNNYYQCVVTGPQISELIKLKFLAQNITRAPKEIVDITKFEIDKLKGDYNERQMATEYKLPKHITNVVKNYHKYCQKKKTIIFNVNIDHSKEVTECLHFCGLNARHLDSNSDKNPSPRPGFDNERDEILDWFKNTEDAILCNVMIATVGFDEPTIFNVIINFATLSLVKFIQCCGRGGRIIDDNFIKKHHKDYPYELQEKWYFNIIDLGANCVRFGDWNDDRDWDYIFNHPQLAGDGIAPVKTCPDCEGIVHAATRVCPLTNYKGEYCLYEFVVKKAMEEQDLEEMILMTKGINVDELINRDKKKFQLYTFLEMGDGVVYTMFKNHGSKIDETTARKYFRTYYELCCDWYSKTLAKVDGNIEDIRDSGYHIRVARNNFNKLINKYNRQFELQNPTIDSNALYELVSDTVVTANFIEQ